MLARSKQNPIFECMAEKVFYAERSLPSMHKQTLAIAPLALVVPLFSIARYKSGQEKTEINLVWTKKGRGCLRYIGPRLSQSHQTVLFTLANLRAGAVVSNAFSFYPSELLTKMGWSDNSENIIRLRELLDDLVTGRVKIWNEFEVEDIDALRVSFVSAFKPAKNSAWYVVLSEDLLPLFAGGLTYVKLPSRAKLTEGLPTFLYSYIKANGCSLPFSYQDLHDACGAEYGNMSDFAKSVRPVLENLKAKGLIQDFCQKSNDKETAPGLRLKKGQFRVLKAATA